jgi:hypothetical protein
MGGRWQGFGAPATVLRGWLDVRRCAEPKGGGVPSEWSSESGWRRGEVAVLADERRGEATGHDRATQLHHEVEELTRRTLGLTAWSGMAGLVGLDHHWRRRR